MLYTPPDPAVDLDDPKAPWSLQGFWGYQHWIEHQFSRMRGESRIVVEDDTLHVGLNVDPRIDDALGVPFVGDIVSFFQRAGGSACLVREKKHQLALAIKSTTFADQIIYFGCHGLVSGTVGASAAEAHLRLGDDDPIFTSELSTWLNERPTGTLTTNPVVFVNACQGAQMSSSFSPSFGLEFMRHGANCLVGPQVDLPAGFAVIYATHLFEEFLKPGTRLGDIVRNLARECAEIHHNPLGLTFAVYRGLDTHLEQNTGPQ
jgi:hypothetical protein